MLLKSLINLPLAFAAAAPSSLRTREAYQWTSLLGVGPAPHTILPTFNVTTISPSGVYNGSNVVLFNTTVRQTFRVSQASEQLRLRISNTYGDEPLDITSMTIALPSPNHAGSSSIQPGTLKVVTFQGNASASVPTGADWFSDPIQLPVVDGCEVSISTYLASGHPPQLTYHQTALRTTFYTMGDATMDQDLTGPNVANDTSGYFIFTIDGWSPQSTGLIACIGDSITDGYLSGFDANLRYPDQLSDRLNSDALSSRYAVVNMGISSNRVLSDGGWGGQSLLTRMDHDLFSLNGLTHVVLLEGINDIVFGTMAPPLVPASDLIQAYEQFIQALHIKGIAVIGATITPYKVPAGFNVSSFWSEEGEATREAVNDWIRTSNKYDYFVDFDKAVRNASFPEQMQLAFAGADFLHPNGKGYAAMAGAFDLSIFDKLKGKANNYQ